MNELELLKSSKSDGNEPIPHIVTIVNNGDFPTLSSDTKPEELKELGSKNKGYLTRITDRTVENLIASPMYWIRLTVPPITVAWGTNSFETEITSSDRKNTFNIFERSHGKLFNRIMNELAKGAFNVLANGDVQLTKFAISGNWKTKKLDWLYVPQTRVDGKMVPLQATYTDPTSATGYRRGDAKRGDLYVFVLADEHEDVPMTRAFNQAERSKISDESSAPEHEETTEEARVRKIMEDSTLTIAEKNEQIAAGKTG